MKMFFEVLLIIIAVIAVLFLLYSYAGVLLSPVVRQNSTGSVCIGPFGSAQDKKNCFKVELAKTASDISKGLMYRKELGKDNGMLFIFDKEGIYPFWMKNTLIPLDIIWIDKNNKVVFISQNVQPCKSLICPSVVPSAKAKYVLEINAGIAEEISLKLGDELKIK